MLLLVACPQGIQKKLAAGGMLLCPQQLLPQLLHLCPQGTHHCQI